MCDQTIINWTRFEGQTGIQRLVLVLTKEGNIFTARQLLGGKIWVIHIPGVNPLFSPDLEEEVAFYCEKNEAMQCRAEDLKCSK